MNVFKAFKHVSGKKPKPLLVVHEDGEVILGQGQDVDCLHLLVHGTVQAYGLEDDGVHDGRRARTYRRLGKQEPSPIFGAENYFYCRPSALVYRALGRVELCLIGSDLVLDLGQRSEISILARELIRDSDLSPELLDRLKAKHEETGLPGFDVADPRGILATADGAHAIVYAQFAQELMVELFMQRRNRSNIMTTKIVQLEKPAWMSHDPAAPVPTRRIP